jgi:tetratricopeptide (TPR) repeat protein
VQADSELGLRLVGALHLWLYRHMVSEGRRWAEDFLARPATTRRTVGRAKALLAAAVLAWVQSDYQGGALRSGESVALWRSRCDRPQMLLAPYWLVGMYAGHRAGRRVHARVYALGVECVVHHREAGDHWHLAAALLGFGILVSSRGNPAEARPLLEESAALFRALGDGWWGGAALLTLGSLALNHRDNRAARTFLEEALSLSREAGDKRNTAMCLDRLGRILQWEGEHARAEALLREGLVLEQEVGSTEGIASCLDGLALAAHARGRDEAAARLCAATLELRTMTGARADRSLRDRTGQLVAELRAALGEDAFAAAYAQGRALSLDEAVALALEQTTSL